MIMMVVKDCYVNVDYDLSLLEYQYYNTYI